MKHPAQKPNPLSNAANIANKPITLFPATGLTHMNNPVPTIDTINPTNWANLFGGPGTGFSGISRTGTTSRVAIRPIGLNVGPVSTLATKPYTRNSNNQSSPVKIVAMAKANTMAATDLAATSFTGLGKLKIDFMEIKLLRS